MILVTRFIFSGNESIAGLCKDGNGLPNSSKVDLGGPVVIILASGSEVRWFDPGWDRWIFSERKNPEYDFLRR